MMNPDPINCCPVRIQDWEKHLVALDYYDENGQLPEWYNPLPHESSGYSVATEGSYQFRSYLRTPKNENWLNEMKSIRLHICKYCGGIYVPVAKIMDEKND